MRDETLKWARDCWEDDIRRLYTDPIAFAEIEERDSWEQVRDKTRAMVSWLTDIGNDLGVSFEAVVARDRTEPEIGRMEKLLLGIIDE